MHLKLNTTPIYPAHCWLLARTAHVFHYSNAYFLMSSPCETKEQSLLQREGLITSLNQALDFFEHLLAGKISGHVVMTLCHHFQQVTPHNNSSFALETQAFAKQFTNHIPQQGLRGFLEKKTKRLEPKNISDLEQTRSWLRQALHK